MTKTKDRLTVKQQSVLNFLRMQGTWTTSQEIFERAYGGRSVAATTTALRDLVNLELAEQDGKRFRATRDDLAKVLDLQQDEFEIYRDFEAHGGGLDPNKLERLAKHEAARRRLGQEPITGAMVAAEKGFGS